MKTKPRIQSRAGVDSLSFNEKALLPNGVRVEKWTTCDTFWGRKHELIAAGCALPEWFPDAPIVGKQPGTTKGRFHYPDPAGCGDVLLARSGQNIWRVELPIVKELEERRHAELKAHWERRDKQQQQKKDDEQRATVVRDENEFQERLAACLKRLPVFVPGSMSEGEIHVMRVLRAIDDRHWNTIINIAERFLASEKCDESPEKPTAPHLRLVVSNEERK